MPYAFRFKIDGDIQFECTIESQRCEHRTGNNRCKRLVCIGTDLCWSHSITDLCLRVKESNIPDAGRGLFACQHRVPPDHIVFRPGDILCEYQGEIIDTDEVDRRYTFDRTAPYTVKTSR